MEEGDRAGRTGADLADPDHAEADRGRKTVYETIGKLAGINVLFDPDYTSRRIRVDLNGVTLQEALEITALESKTFWRPVTPNTIFVAADTPAKRKELEQSVIRTFYLTNLSQPNELQDLVNILRTLLDTQRLQQFPSQQAIVVRGTPDQIAMAEKLIEDLDKSKPEVVVEVAIMQVTRNKLRNLGINPPTQRQRLCSRIEAVLDHDHNRYERRDRQRTVYDWLQPPAASA